MALDSKEMSEFLAGMAAKHGADAIILSPTLKTAWEYNKDGKVIRQNVHPLEIPIKGTRIHCIPSGQIGGEAGFWSCGVYSRAGEDEVELEHFTEQLPG